MTTATGHSHGDFPVDGHTSLADALESLGVHDHLCLIYENREEQFAAVIPFMRIGLERGEKCIYIADDNAAADVIQAMRDEGVDVDAGMKCGALAVIGKQESYLKQGFFDPDWMIGFLKQATDQAKADGYSALRVTGEMTWTLGGDPGSERLMEYESKLNYFFPEHDALAICQYNLNRFAPDTLRGVIETHPIVVHGNGIFRNFYFVPPDEFLGRSDGGGDIARLLKNMADRQRIEERLRDSRDLIKSIVEHVPIRIFWKDRELRYLGCNALFARDAGFDKPDQLIGRSDLDMPWKEQAESYHADDMAVMQSGKARLNFEEQQTTRDGRTVWLRTSKVPLCDARQRVIGVLGIYHDITEQKLAADRLALSESRLKEAQQVAHLGSWELDVQANELWWSDENYRVFGAEPGSKNTYETFLERVHPDDREYVDREYSGSVKNRTPFNIEHRLLMPDGSVRWVNERCVTYYAEDGTPLRSVGTTMDITERRLAETLLKESEYRYRQMIEGLHSEYFLYQHNAEGVLTYVSASVKDVLGYAPEEMLDQSYERFVTDNPINKQAEKYTELAFKGERQPSYEMELCHKNGDKHLVEVIESPVFDKDGKVIALEGICHDITERKRNQEALQASEVRNRMLFESVADYALVLEVREGGPPLIVDANQAAFEKHGYTREEMIGQPISMIDDSIDAKMMHTVLKHAEAGELVRFESRHRCKDGSEFDVEVASRKIVYGGRPMIFAVERDITERKQVEVQLHEHIGELERFQKATINREFRIKELKDEIVALKARFEEGST